MKKCLMLVTQGFDNKILNGGDVINKRNYQFLQENFDKVDVLICRKYTNSIIGKIYSKFKNVINLSIADCRSEIVTYIKSVVNNYDIVFIGQSSLGEFAKVIKKCNPSVKVITFFHNVEYDYYNTQSSSFRCYLGIYAKIAKLNEKKAILFSDKIITLNVRDSDRLYDLYGRKADLILPTSFKNKELKFLNDTISKDELRLLFIGSNFYPNKQGIIWFITDVLTKLDNTILEIIGRGTSRWKNESIFNNSKVWIYGEVEDLDYYYLNADAVIIPIFTGGGMKTKTAEALLYGKYIFATKEAFEGYHVKFDKVGGMCNNSVDFIHQLNDFRNSGLTKYNNYSREIFLKYYDEKTNSMKFQNFLRFNKY